MTSQTTSHYLKSAPLTDADAARLQSVRDTVTEVIAAVRERGDAAVREYSEKFDGWSPASFRLSEDDIEKIIATVPQQVITDILAVQQRVRTSPITSSTRCATLRSRLSPAYSWARRTSRWRRQALTCPAAATPS